MSPSTFFGAHPIRSPTLALRCSPLASHTVRLCSWRPASRQNAHTSYHIVAYFGAPFNPLSPPPPTKKPLQVAGNATVASMINLGLYELMTHPDQMEALR
jgi:hypothetical protein